MTNKPANAVSPEFPARYLSAVTRSLWQAVDWELKQAGAGLLEWPLSPPSHGDDNAGALARHWAEWATATVCQAQTNPHFNQCRGCQWKLHLVMAECLHWNGGGDSAAVARHLAEAKTAILNEYADWRKCWGLAHLAFRYGVTGQGDRATVFAMFDETLARVPECKGMFSCRHEYDATEYIKAAWSIIPPALAWLLWDTRDHQYDARHTKFCGQIKSYLTEEQQSSSPRLVALRIETMLLADWPHRVAAICNLLNIYKFLGTETVEQILARNLKIAPLLPHDLRLTRPLPPE
jgi:hypothetical protein